MKAMLITWVVLTIGFLLAGAIVPRFSVKSWVGGAIIGALYGVLMATLGKFLFGLFAIGSIGLALVFDGITTFIVSVIVIKVADLFTDSVDVDGWVPAILGALVLVGVNAARSLVLG